MLSRASDEIGLDAGIQANLHALARLVVAEGERVNLSAVRCVPGALVTHVVDALSLVPLLDEMDASSVVDVGAGAGLPGLVLAVARPEWGVTLVEAARKKVSFQETAVRELGLSNVEPVWARAEEFGRGEGRECFDVAVARAVARMPVVAELCLPMVRRGGLFVAQKSLDGTATEVRRGERAVKMLGGRVRDVAEAWTEELVREAAGEFGEGVEREDDRRKCLVVVEKVRETPEGYPRMFNAIKKKPL